MATAMRAVPEVAVVGGGYAGLACAMNLCKRGVKVTLIEQGRGLGGRVCTRHAKDSTANITFDHGCQYLSPKAPAFQSIISTLQAEGLVGLWGQDGTIGDISTTPSGQLDLASFKGYPASKQLYVGLPGNSAVGKRMAAMCGANLSTVTATRAEQLTRTPSGHWQLRLQSRASDLAALEALAAAEARSFSAVVTAMSANSTARLLKDVNKDIAQAAAAVNSNVCWALLLATRQRLPLPFNGALVARSSSLAWLARDSSKPGRTSPAGGAGDAWVVHAMPGWSNQRKDVPRGEVAQQLLQEFCAAAGVQLSADDLTYIEAHRWNNAYPLNPRAASPVELGSQQLSGCFMMEAERRLVVCGDWCLGPRAGDAFLSGHEAAEAVMAML